MKPSTELFDLIKSLTKSEKRFFKLFSSLQAGEKNYSRLFDYIEKQNTYDEAVLKEHFKGATFIKHLPSEKNHLYRLLLKSLRQFYGEQSISNIIKEEIKNVEILYNKALLKEASKVLKRAKKIAHENEEFYFLIDLIAWEKTLITAQYESGDFDVDLNKLIEEENLAIEKLRNLAEYHMLYSKINALFRSDGFVKNPEQIQMVDEIAEHHLIKGKNTALSVRAATICYYIQGLCAAVKRDFETSYTKFHRTKHILDNSPKIKIDLGQRYMLTLFHLMQCYIDSEDFKMAQSILDDISNLEGQKGFNSLQISLRIRNIALTKQMHLYNLQGEFEKALTLFESDQEKHLELIEKSNKESRIVFYFTMAYTYFGTDNFKSSLQYTNLLINDNESKLRQDIYSFARVLNLMLHYELGNFEHLEYCFQSTIRYLNKNKQNHEVVNVFSKQLKKIGNNLEYPASLEQLQETLKQVQSLLKEDNERVILDFIDIESWLEAKIKAISFPEAIQAKFRT